MEQWRAELYHSEIYHHGVLGMKWGVRRYQNPDGSLTEAGRKKYSKFQAKVGKAKGKTDKLKNKVASSRARYDQKAARQKDLSSRRIFTNEFAINRAKKGEAKAQKAFAKAEKMQLKNEKVIQKYTKKAEKFAKKYMEQPVYGTKEWNKQYKSIDKEIQRNDKKRTFDKYKSSLKKDLNDYGKGKADNVGQSKRTQKIQKQYEYENALKDRRAEMLKEKYQEERKKKKSA